ncbi:uncharacterized protein METZ01_LOCUS249576, partial [marine metagenome]
DENEQCVGCNEYYCCREFGDWKEQHFCLECGGKQAEADEWTHDDDLEEDGWYKSWGSHDQEGGPGLGL